jgi:hypothetical protein
MRPHFFNCRPGTGRVALIANVYRFEPAPRKPPERLFKSKGFRAVFGGLYVAPGNPMSLN